MPASGARAICRLMSLIWPWICSAAFSCESICSCRRCVVWSARTVLRESANVSAMSAARFGSRSLAVIVSVPTSTLGRAWTLADRTSSNASFL